MTDMACNHCGATTTNGLALCELCQRMAVACLDVLPIYFRNLARWRPGRAGSRDVPGSRVLYDGVVRGQGTGDRISDAVDEAFNALTTWARALAEDRPHFPRPLTYADAVLTGDLPIVVADRLADNQAEAASLLCLAFERHLTSIATLDWCGEFVRAARGKPGEDHEGDGIGYHEAKLRRLTEIAIPGWYAGACRRRVTMESACGAPTYVIPGFTWVTCAACGSTTYARDHLETILDEARGWVARPLRLAEAAVALIDTEQSVTRLYERIKKWEQRARIVGHRKRDEDGDEVGAKSYQFGDVLDLLFTEGQTRTGVTSERIGA